ncbi:LuxR C-terminal-related transcriptional regulator [Caballeronia sp.]|uniref:LuxR C-terminal-related transcriptional regulator n=1 Tax=Caballeronia sp. TaxID=1931223 RepID=UPI003C538844
MQDNDIVRFVSHLLEATRRTGLVLSNDTVSLLSSEASQGEAPFASLKTTLLNELSFLDADLFLFFDDFHFIKDPRILDLISSLLLAPIEHLHFVISSRQQLALPVARLRALGEIREFDAAMLKFSSNEAMEFMGARIDLPLTQVQMEHLWTKTEGWIASLQMVTIAMQGLSDPEAFLRQFSGADRSIADFLVEEVLNRQTEEVQRFLLATSILDRFNSDLCNAVLERRDSSSLIDNVEDSNLFVFSLDRERNWYRYHKLFADLLRKRLVDRFPDEAAIYNRRACNWLAENDYIADAIEHAFAASEPARAGALIDEISPTLLASGQTATLRRFAERLPESVAKSLPRLQLELAWENTILWRFDEARHALKEVRSKLVDRVSGSPVYPAEEPFGKEAELFRMKLAHREFLLNVFTDDIEHSLPAAKLWIAEFGDRDKFMGSSVGGILMMLNRETYQCEHTQAHAQELRNQFIEANAIYGTVFLDTVVGSIHFARGELQLAEQAYLQSRADAIRIQSESSTLATMPSAQLAQLLYEKNNLGEARQLVENLNGHPSEFRFVDSVIARYITATRLARTDGMTGKAHDALDLATRIADRYALPRLHAHVLAERVPLLISDGLCRDAERLILDPRYKGVAAVMSFSGHVDTAKECFAIATARIAFERGERSHALKILRRWLNWTRERQCLRSSIRLAVLLACLCYRSGDKLAARRTMIDALRWGSSGGFTRSFLDEGPTVVVILEELADLTTEANVFSIAYLSFLLSAFGRQIDKKKTPPIIQMQQGESEDARGLSEREIEILQLTSTNLVTSEIAAALGLAESTVKWYWKRIFEKLGVHRRSLAVRVARMRGLIA